MMVRFCVAGATAVYYHGLRRDLKASNVASGASILQVRCIDP